jgi:FkbM family methyltransferase
MAKGERKKLERFPRYKHTSSVLLGKKVQLTDPFWYLQTYDEIFSNQIYSFRAKRSDPLIIDCGANIGLSTIYFKYIYPKSRIIAFEPDPEIFQVLETNIKTFQFSDVTLYERAVWVVETQLGFQSDGSVGGALVPDEIDKKHMQVKTVRLKDFLDQEVDFLKMDIEGAEYEVILDSSDALNQVDNLFVEYHGKKGEPQKLHEILQIICDQGFRYHLKEANPVRHPFILGERKRKYDLQLNIFAFRERD